MKRIKCLDCGELLADSDAFQAHCMDESVEVPHHHPPPTLANALGHAPLARALSPHLSEHSLTVGLVVCRPQHSDDFAYECIEVEVVIEDGEALPYATTLMIAPC